MRQGQIDFFGKEKEEVERIRLLLPVVDSQTDKGCMRIWEGGYVFADNFFFKKSKLNKSL